MSRLLRNPRVLFLLFLAIVLTGCQHPLGPAIAGPQPALADHALLNAQATARVQRAMQAPAPTTKVVACLADASVPQSPTPKAAPLMASAQQQPVCLEGQLGDCLLQMFKTFTGRH